MKIKAVLLSAILCMSLLFFSCRNNFDRIEIPADKIEEVESSMRFIKQTLEKSTFDTVEMVKTEIQRGINYELQINTRALSKDSISKEVYKNFKMDQIFPSTRNLYCNRDGSIMLNSRLIGKDFAEFEKNIVTCRELENLKLDDKKKFIESVAILLANNIWSCRDDQYSADKRGYYFDYSEENNVVNRWQDRYLYLVEDVQNELIFIDEYNDEYKLIDKKNGLRLYRLYRRTSN